MAKYSVTKDKHVNGLENILDGWNVLWIFSLPGLIAFCGIFWAQHEILKICKWYFSPKPKEDLDSESVHCFTPFWQPLQKEKCTGKVKDQSILQTNKQKRRPARKGCSFQMNSKVMYKHKCVNFYDSTNICSKQSILKQGLVPYNILILSSELWHIQYCPVSLQF